MKRTTLLILVLAGCGGGAPDDIERICIAATECGAIGANETDLCISELDAATPDSAGRAAAECADCLDRMSCGAVASGGCAETCTPLRDTVNQVQGTASTNTTDNTCAASSTNHYAIKSNLGNLMIKLDCTPYDYEIIPGPYDSFAVGDTKPCGKFSAGPDACPITVTGTVSIVQKDGRRWVKGSCNCGTVNATFEVPYRLAF